MAFKKCELTPDELKKRRKTRYVLKQMQLPIPEHLQDRLLYRVKDKLGTISVVEGAGVRMSPAVATVKRFEANIGGKDSLIEALEVQEDTLGEREGKLLELLRDKSGRNKSLARLLAESGVAPTKAMTLYSRGCVELGRVEAAIEAHRGLPQLVKNLNSHALSEAGDRCTLCAGTGEVSKIAGTKGPAQAVTCPKCDGIGKAQEPSKLKQFAAEKLLEVTGQTAKGGVNVTTNVGVKVESGGGVDVLSRVMGGMDQMLYKRLPASVAEVVEGEMVNG